MATEISSDPKADEYFMEQALAVAQEGLDRGELPIGAIVVAEGKVISSAYTQEKTQGRFLVHADLLAVDAADRIRPFPGKRREATLFVNLEPCPMCLGAAMSAFLGRVCYGLESPIDGGVELLQSWRRPDGTFPSYRFPAIQGGVLRERNLELLRAYIDRHPTGPMTDWTKALLDSVVIGKKNNP